MPLPLTMAEDGPILQPERVLKTHTILRGQTQVPQVLIKWVNIPEEEATWESAEQIQHGFPTFNLEDKVVIRGDGDVITKSTTNTDVERDTMGAVAPGAEMRRGERKRTTNSRLRDYVWG